MTLTSTPRTIIDFDRDWRFSKGDFAGAMQAAFDDTHWRQVNVPHDWRIELPLGRIRIRAGRHRLVSKTLSHGRSDPRKLAVIEFDAERRTELAWRDSSSILR